MFTFPLLRAKDLELVLKWRSSERVNRWMASVVKNTLKEQEKWFRRMNEDDSCHYWLINYRCEPIGVIYMTDLDRDNKRCKWGFYIGEDKYPGIGGFVPPYFYNYALIEKGLEKVEAEVLTGNEVIVSLHNRHGCRKVGVRRHHYLKEDEWIDVCLYELVAEDWRGNKDRYGAYRAEFEERGESQEA